MEAATNRTFQVAVIIRSIELLQGSRASVTETELEKMYAVLYTLARISF